MDEQMTATRMKRWGLRCGVAAVSALCLLGGCKCGDGEVPAEKRGIAFCEDPTIWDQWEAYVGQFDWDDGMMELHALRLGICSMIYTGQIEPERGIRLFEKAHFAWMERIVGMQLQGMESRPDPAEAPAPPQGGQ